MEQINFVVIIVNQNIGVQAALTTKNVYVLCVALNLSWTNIVKQNAVREVAPLNRGI